MTLKITTWNVNSVRFRIDLVAKFIKAVRPAAGPGGWASGVYERGGSTNVPNINTAAVVLEAALFERLGRPLLSERQ